MATGCSRPDIRAIALQIKNAQDEGRQIKPLTSQLSAFDVRSAYAVADLVHRARLQEGAVAVCGYHSEISGVIYYAVMPYAGCTGCLGGLSTLDAMTSTSSHELCEAITDPIPGRGWYDDANGEIGDICAWKTKKVGQYTVQLGWSNRGNNCM